MIILLHGSSAPKLTLDVVEARTASNSATR
jgi:hypothetical protein